ncbi:intraflagellar transport protein 43-domain-containing protein [Polychytrium aggregatum]|uniref:intraflagellar transport protein 43-domain-containing protein n=1 Tax=Polychytrium aggregatum TaxID=110093 RepID=UPI0022FE2E4E|nr:intraflagellar transport protein 43-domain-containing protein [Polychytrium aggregatum]KAI9193266.1 intraflagellar transport protein 43-domain-containing protein [Polychytrium aggregatum]
MSVLRDEEDNPMKLPESLLSAPAEQISPSSNTAQGIPFSPSSSPPAYFVEPDAPPPGASPAPKQSRRRRAHQSTENISDLLSDSPSVPEQPSVLKADVSNIPGSKLESSAFKGWGEGTESMGRRPSNRLSESQAETVRKSRGDIDDEKESRWQNNQTDEVTVIIPDLNDVEDDEFLTTMASAPAVKTNAVKTINELDNELSLTMMGNMYEGLDLKGIDLSLLATRALCTPQDVIEHDTHWDWDVLFTEIATQMEQIDMTASAAEAVSETSKGASKARESTAKDAANSDAKARAPVELL